MTALLTEDATPDSGPEPLRRRPHQRLGMNAPRILIVIALVMWLVALPSLPTAELSQFGLLATASPLLLGSMLVAGIAFVVGLRSKRFLETVVALVLLGLLERLPATLATDVPLYSWTYKHLGVVDYIQQSGQLAHGLDVYQGWPGLFALTAWFSSITGIAPLTIAHWFTPVLHLALIGLVYVLARVWKLGPFPALMASFLVESLNWVAQDYYSPQALALLLAVGFLIVVGLSLRTPVATPLALIIFAAIVVTHQLTPYWLIIACLVLMVCRRLQPRWLILPMIGLAGIFLAFNYDTASQFSLLSLNPFQNLKSNIPTVGVPGQQLTSVLVRTLSVVLWLGTVLCIAPKRRRKEAVLAPGILALSSFLLLGGQSYGGEAVFRVFLYSLFGCALVIAPVLTRAIDTSPRRAVLIGILLIGALTASAQGYFGGWFAYKISLAEVTEARSLLATSQFPAYLPQMAPAWPERSTGRYVPYAAWTATGQQVYDYPLISSANLIGSDFSTDADYTKFMETAQNSLEVPTYLIISHQMAIYDWYFGILPADALNNLQLRMRADPRWAVYKSTSDYVIFKSTPALIGAN